METVKGHQDLDVTVTRRFRNPLERSVTKCGSSLSQMAAWRELASELPTLQVIWVSAFFPVWLSLPVSFWLCLSVCLSLSLCLFACLHDSLFLTNCLSVCLLVCLSLKQPPQQKIWVSTPWCSFCNADPILFCRCSSGFLLPHYQQ